jgi:hypothetical protein
MSALVNGKDRHPGSFPIKALYHPKTDVSLATFYTLNIAQDGIVKGPFKAGMGRLKVNTGRLVDNQQISILKQNMLGAEGKDIEGATIEIDLDRLPGSHSQGTAANATPCYMNTAEVYYLASDSPGKICNLTGDILIDAQASILCIDGETIDL